MFEKITFPQAEITICARFVGTCVNDSDAYCRILMGILAEDGNVLVAVDGDGENGAILDLYQDVVGAEGAGQIRWWLHYVLLRNLIQPIPVERPAEGWEIFAQVCRQTESRVLFCERDEHYRGMLGKYPGMRLLTRARVRADKNTFVEEVLMRQVVVLFVAAEPNKEARVQAGEEHREISERLRLGKLAANYELTQAFAVRPADLSQALLDSSPQIVHFTGHGSPSGEIILQDASGDPKPVSGKALASLFASFRDTVSCVVLNACYSAAQAGAILEHIPYIVTLPAEISNRAAIDYSVGFYQGLAAGKDIPACHALGCSMIEMDGAPIAQKPQLLQR
jgi:hypothetical protein